MKNHLLPLLKLVGAALCLGSCQLSLAAAPPTPPSAGTTTVSDADAGKEVKLHVGDTFLVRLESNATTGYGWRTKERKGNSLATVGKQPNYEPDQTKPGVVGSGGHDLFRFNAKKKGTETLRFVYARPWKPAEVAKEARFRVVVQ